MDSLLLLSSSTVYGKGYLDHAEAEIRALFEGVSKVLFLPYALHDRAGYTAKVRRRLEGMGLAVDSADEAPDPAAAIAAAQGLFVGGGNTFRLLDGLHARKLLDFIRRGVQGGLPYLGSSAGSIVACPSLKTTKDMPVVEPPSFEALGLVPFQISPHYLDPDPASTHMGEAQEERILQFHEENGEPVVGLREPAMLRVDGGSVVLKGDSGARIFRRGRQPVEARPVCRLESLLAARES